MQINVIITLTEQRRHVPFSTGSTHWYISLSNIVISRFTLVKNLRAHSGNFIPQHDWMRDGWGRTTSNLYGDGEEDIIIDNWSVCDSGQHKEKVTQHWHYFGACHYLCMRCLALSRNHQLCTVTRYFLRCDKILFYSSRWLCFQGWSCHSTLALYGAV